MLFEMRLKEWKRHLLGGVGMTGGQVAMFLKDGEHSHRQPEFLGTIVTWNI